MNTQSKAHAPIRSIRSGLARSVILAISLLGVAACHSDAEELALTPEGTAAPVVTAQESPKAPTVIAKAETCQNCGVVTKIKKLVKEGDADGIGLITGAVIGGVLGNQVGSGSGKDAATVGGAIAGGYAGNEIEKDFKEEDAGYRVTILMDNGTEAKIKVKSKNGLEQGNRVRVINGKDIQRV